MLRKTELPFSPHKRLARQVLHLENALEGIASKMELIMEKLGLQGKAKGNEKGGKLTVTNNSVSMDEE